MHPRKLLLGALALCLLQAAGLREAQAKPKPGIVKGAAMRLAGRHDFRAIPARTGGAVKWTVDREERDESGGALFVVREVALAQGRIASFDLPKTPGKETVYLIHAKGEGFEDVERIQIFPANARTSFTHRSGGNPDVRVYAVVPASLSPATRVVMVMHGQTRNADDYADSWVKWASENDRLVLAPEFDNKRWRGAESYNLGNVFTEDDGGGELNPEARWSFTVVEGIHEQAREGFRLRDSLFDLWGHSAGGQFVHRFLLFKPRARVRHVLAANPGWYTTPDLSTDFPFGLKHPRLAFTRRDVLEWTRRPMFIFRGMKDTERGENLRTTPDADRQGPNRYERAGFMRRAAFAFDPRTRWQLIDVPDAGHDQRKMAPAAQKFLSEQHAALSRK